MSHYTDEILVETLSKMQHQFDDLADSLYAHSSQLEEDAPNVAHKGRAVSCLNRGVLRVQRMMRKEIEALLAMNAEQLKNESHRGYLEANPDPTRRRLN